LTARHVVPNSVTSGSEEVVCARVEVAESWDCKAIARPVTGMVSGSALASASWINHSSPHIHISRNWRLQLQMSQDVTEVKVHVEG
jgi:hypothetical protein